MDNIWQNPVAIKVHNGTMHSDVNLCATCRNAFHAQPSNSGREIMRCMATNPPTIVRDLIGKCTGYQDKTKPTLHDMMDVAWIVMTDKGGRKIGFLSPEELRQRDYDGSQPPRAPGFGA